MDLRDYLRVLRTSWALLLVGLVLGTGAALGVTSLLTPRYTVSTQLFVSTTGTDDLTTALQGNYLAEGKVASYAQLLRSKQLATDVLDDTGLDLSTQQLIDRIGVEILADTTILDVTVTDTSPRRALTIAQSIDREFQALVRDLETPEGEQESPVRITVIATPELPEAPSFPAREANMVLGAVLGLLLAAFVAVVRDRLDTTVKDDDTAQRLAGAPVVGHLPVSEELGGTRPPQPHGMSPAAEAVRHVRTNLAFVDVDHPPRTILVSSSVPGEGKTTLAVNLAVALAEAGNSVALLEADLRRPRVTRYLGLVGGVGVTNVLTGAASLDEVTQPVGDGRLEVLAAGPLPPNPSELLASEAMAALVRELADRHDMVIIDAPPLLPVADASALTGLVDGVLLCARWGVVETTELERSGALLHRLDARLLGLVMTQVPARSAPVAYGYGQVAPTARRSLLDRLRFRRPAPDALLTVAPVRPRAGGSRMEKAPTRSAEDTGALVETGGR